MSSSATALPSVSSRPFWSQPASRRAATFAELRREAPGEWRRLAADPLSVGPAVEEIVRCASPVIHFRRTATQDTELSGVPIMEELPAVALKDEVWPAFLRNNALRVLGLGGGA